MPDKSWLDDAGCGSDGDFRWTLDDLSGMPLLSEFDIEDVCCLNRTGTRKRSRDEACSGGANSKACREKMRRDRLNCRFMELSTVLDPGKPPKSDKASILDDAAQVLVHLKKETKDLEEENEKLQDAIKDLKAEKNELRDEKMKLKDDKERLEQQLKLISAPPAGFMPPNPAAAFHAASSAFALQAQASTNKTHMFPAYPYLPTWQWLPHGPWLPPASQDTTDDPKQISPSA